MNNETLTAAKVQLNDVPPPGFTAPGKSLINEVEKLKEAVLLLCELQKELTKKVDEALNGKTALDAPVDAREANASRVD